MAGFFFNTNPASSSSPSPFSFASSSSSSTSKSPFSFSSNPSSSPSLFGASTPSNPTFGTPTFRTPSSPITTGLFGSSGSSLTAFGASSSAATSASSPATCFPSLFSSSSSSISSSTAVQSTTSSTPGFSFLSSSSTRSCLFTTVPASSAPSFSFPSAPTSAPSFSFSTSSAAVSSTGAVGSSGAAASTTSLFAGSSSSSSSALSFGNVTVSSATVTTSASASASTTTPAFSAFGVTSSSTKASTATGSLPSFASPATAAATTGTSSSFFGFQTSSKTLGTSTPASQPQTTAASSLFGASASLTTTSTVTTTTAQTSSALVVSSSSGTTASVSTAIASAPKLPSEITGKTVEEIIIEWNLELEEQTSKVRKQANAIAEWDRRILQNRDVLLKLEPEVVKVVDTQSNLERQLELIETHQQEVDKSLQSVEEEAERIYKDEHGLLLDDEAASTRDAMFEQAEFIEREMEQMTEQIETVTQTLNANQVLRSPLPKKVCLETILDEVEGEMLAGFGLQKSGDSSGGSKVEKRAKIILKKTTSTLIEPERTTSPNACPPTPPEKPTSPSTRPPTTTSPSSPPKTTDPNMEEPSRVEKDEVLKLTLERVAGKRVGRGTFTVRPDDQSGEEHSIPYPHIYHPRDAGKPFVPDWGVVHDSRFNDIETCHDFLVNYIPPAEHVYQRTRGRQELLDENILSLTNFLSTTSEIVREWGSLLQDRQHFLREKEAFEKERDAQGLAVREAKWAVVTAREEKEKAEKRLASREVDWKLACEMTNQKLLATFEREQKLKDELHKAMQETSRLRDVVEARDVELASANEGLKTKDAALAECNMKIAELEAAKASLVSERDALEDKVGDITDEVKLLQGDRKWLFTECIPEVAHYAKDGDLTRKAVGALTVASKLVGRKAGFLEGFQHAQEGKSLEEFALHDKDVDALLKAKSREFDDLELPLVDFIVSHVDQATLYELQQSLYKAGYTYASELRKIKEGEGQDEEVVEEEEKAEASGRIVLSGSSEDWTESPPKGKDV